MNKLQKIQLALRTYFAKVSFSVEDDNFSRTKIFKEFKNNFKKAFIEQLNEAIEDGLIPDINRALGKQEDFEVIEEVSISQKEQIAEQVEAVVQSLIVFLPLGTVVGYYTTIANTTGQKVMEELKIVATFQLTNESILATYTNRANLLIQDIDETTKEFITDQIIKGLENGLSVGDMVEEIQKQYPEYADWRAERIVRTETQTIIGDTEFRTYKNNGTTQKKWITARDDRVRASHAENANQGWISIDDTFKTGHLHHPGGINCRCATLYQKPIANNNWIGG